MPNSKYRIHLAKGRRVNKLKRRGAELNLTQDDQRRIYEQALAAGKQVTKLEPSVYDERQSSIQRYRKPLTSSPTIAR